MTTPAAEAKAVVDSGPVVIVGGGFGGLSAALTLSQQRPRPPIVLIEPNERFVFLPLLYELLSRELQVWEVAPSYDSLLRRRGIAWIRDQVSTINTVERTVLTTAGDHLPYGHLILASGSEPEDFGIPGVREHALRFHNLKDVVILRERIQALKRQHQRSMVIVGAGAAGVELACKLADLVDGAASVHLIERGEEILPNARAFNREQAACALKRRGVVLHLKHAVRSVEANLVNLQDPSLQGDHSPSTSLAHDGLIWTAGTRPRRPELKPEPQCRGGRLLVNDILCSLGSPELLAIGDVAMRQTMDDAAAPWPHTAQAALQQGEAAARTVMALRAGSEPTPFQFRDLGEMLSLGVGEATITGMGLTLAGPLAFRLRRLIYLARLPDLSLGLRSAGAWALGG
jgi:NADH:ubiquinone reductase (non-electrogenic)